MESLVMERESTEEDTVIYHCLRLSNDWTGDTSLAIAASRWIKPFSNRGHFWSRKYILILTDFWSQFVRSFKMSMELGNLQPVLRKFDHLLFINIKVYTDTIIVYLKQYELTLCWTGNDYWKPVEQNEVMVYSIGKTGVAARGWSYERALLLSV